MKKTLIRTADVFEHEDDNIRLARYLKCFNVARHLGIVSGKERNEDSTITLYLTGSAIKVCLYYLLTISSSDNKNILDVLRRIYDITK